VVPGAPELLCQVSQGANPCYDFVAPNDLLNVDQGLFNYQYRWFQRLLNYCVKWVREPTPVTILSRLTTYWTLFRGFSTINTVGSRGSWTTVSRGANPCYDFVAPNDLLNVDQGLFNYQYRWCQGLLNYCVKWVREPTPVAIWWRLTTISSGPVDYVMSCAQDSGCFPIISNLRTKSVRSQSCNILQALKEKVGKEMLVFYYCLGWNNGNVCFYVHFTSRRMLSRTVTKWDVKLYVFRHFSRESATRLIKSRLLWQSAWPTAGAIWPPEETSDFFFQFPSTVTLITSYSSPINKCVDVRRENTVDASCGP